MGPKKKARNLWYMTQSFTYRTCQAIFLDHGMRTEKMEHLVTTRMAKVKQREKMLHGLTKWMGEGQGVTLCEKV